MAVNVIISRANVSVCPALLVPRAVCRVRMATLGQIVAKNANARIQPSVARTMAIVCVRPAGWEIIVKTVSSKSFNAKATLIKKIILVCPEGLYGLHCMEACSCTSPQKVCHAAYGCVCRQGFIGDDCLTPTRNAEQQHSESNSAGVAWGIVVALFVATAMVLFMYRRRRMRNAKIQLADVEFHANPQTPPDRHHFDNPVYALNDHQQLLNNVRPVKPTNLERVRMGYVDKDFESNSNSRGTMARCPILKIFANKFFSRSRIVFHQLQQCGYVTEEPER